MNLFLLHPLTGPDRGRGNAASARLRCSAAGHTAWDYLSLCLIAEATSRSAVGQGLMSMCFADALVALPGALRDPECLVILAAALQRGVPVLDHEGLREMAFAPSSLPFTELVPVAFRGPDPQDTLESSPESDLGSLCEEAAGIVRGARQSSFGPPARSFARIAALWSQILPVSRDLGGADVAHAMIALKLSREVNRHSRDNLVDIIGYAELAGHLAHGGGG